MESFRERKRKTYEEFTALGFSTLALLACISSSVFILVYMTDCDSPLVGILTMVV